MFKISMLIEDHWVDMPHDSGLRLSEACYRADIYKNYNSKRIFVVVNEENGDIEYEV